jgi:hypothetical protein
MGRVLDEKRSEEFQITACLVARKRVESGLPQPRRHAFLVKQRGGDPGGKPIVSNARTLG